MRRIGSLLLVLALVGCPTDDPSPPGADTAGQPEALTDPGLVADVAVDPGPPDLGADLPPDIPPDPGVDPGPPDPGVDPGPPADPMVCTGNIDGQLQPFGGACCYTEASHPQNPDCVWYAEGYGEGECMDAQCITNFCSGGRYCTKSCTIYDDLIHNATGEAGPDGVEDGAINDCFGAADGPYGEEWRCINLANPTQNPYGVCRPGTDFAVCDSHADCPAGEACTVLYILGELEGRCVIPKKDAAAGTEPCNSDPADGPLVHCEGPFCYSFGCMDLCATDDHCASDVCVDGACSKDPGASCATDGDCSAWQCVEYSPYSDDPYSDDFCWPRDCAGADDCRDPDWFCRPYWNGADTVEEVAFAPACRRRDADAVGYGEPCGFEGDGTGLPPCAFSSGCIDNYCGGPCVDDSHCAGDAECLLGDEWGIDVDDDDQLDTYVNVDLCQQWPAETAGVDCTSDADCPPGEHCQYRVRPSGEGAERQWVVEYKCRQTAADEYPFGELCGGDTENDCQSGLCLIPSGGGDGMCIQYCGSKDDCPATVEFGGFTWKSYCLSFKVNNQQSLDPTDDLYVPYCWRTSSIGSLDPCDAQKSCTDLKEYCRAVAIAGNPDEPVVVEHLCLDASEGLDEIPIAQVGEACESWTECRGRHCYPDGDGGRYCSELCSTDEDCQTPGGLPNLACTPETLIARPDPANSGMTSRCVIQKTCLSCDSDEDCGGDWVCVNAGGLADLADMRCGAPCSTVADCADAEHVCSEDIDPTGAPTGKNACLPQLCPDPA